jgi:large subunit ribosomal protein L24
MKIKKNDIIKVISGDFKGKIGKVLNIFAKNNKVQVENIGFYKKHIKSRIYRKYPEGGIIEKSKLINISNVMFFSKDMNRPGRVGYKLNKKGLKTRELRGKSFSSNELI